MPRFFFDVTAEGHVSLDLEGTVLPGAEVARTEAARCFGEMIRCASVVKPPEQWGMEVRDELGQPVATASFSMTAAAE